MYIPASNAEHRPEVIHAFIRAHSFGTLVTSSGGDLLATHLPFVLDHTRGPHGVLQGHLARANSHARLGNGAIDSLAIFSANDAYISPSWYPSKQPVGKVVPTWNYVAVHAHGTLRLVEDDAFLLRHLHALTDVHETGREHPWRVSDAPADYVAQMLRAIVGFELEITRLEGKWKMSQNRSAADIDGVIAGLTASSEASDRAVANVVAERRPQRP